MKKIVFPIIAVISIIAIIYSCKSTVKNNKFKVERNGEIDNTGGIIIVGDSNNVQLQVTKIITNLDLTTQNKIINHIHHYSDSIKYDNKYKDYLNKRISLLENQLSQKKISKKQKKIVEHVSIPREKKKLDSISKRLKINTIVKSEIEKLLKEQSKKVKIDKPKKVVYADNSETFLNALGSYTRIILTQPEYDISPKEYNVLTIFDYNHLEIIGQGEEPVHIFSNRLNDPVINFSGVNNLTLKNLKIGHSGILNQENLGCGIDGDVIDFYDSNDILMDELFLYGCGTQGIDFWEGKNITVTNSEIYDCTNGVFELSKVSNVTFENCTFRNNKVYDRSLFSIEDSKDINIVNSRISKNNIDEQKEISTDFSNKRLFKNLFEVIDSQGLILNNTVIQENEMDYLTTSEDDITLKNITYGSPDNKFRENALYKE